MRAVLWNVVLALIPVLALAPMMALAACSVERVAGANQVIQPGSINQVLAADAIRAEVNAVRCKARLRPVQVAAGLTEVAAAHSGWMAAHQSLSHQSTLTGLATLGDRLARVGRRGKSGTENIGMVHRFGVDLVPSFKIVSAAGCQFTTEAGEAIGSHSYHSLAATLVALWMNSPAHKANILHRKVRSLGSGVAYDETADWCGAFYVTQTFAG